MHIIVYLSVIVHNGASHTNMCLNTFSRKVASCVAADCGIIPICARTDRGYTWMWIAFCYTCIFNIQFQCAESMCEGLLSFELIARVTVVTRTLAQYWQLNITS